MSRRFPLRFAVLGSGSRGNGLVVSVGSTCVLVDCGFAVREAERRLRRVGLDADMITAIAVTHEHTDHVAGAEAFSRRHGCPLWITRGTWRAMGNSGSSENVRFLEAGQSVAVDDLELVPYAVPHDSCEPVQFVFSDGDRRLGLLTDAGSVTPHIEECLMNVDALILECNHDLALLRESPYRESLKRRISGAFGHLSNHQSSRLLGRLAGPGNRLQHVVAAHLSETNNRPDLARSALSSALGCAPAWIEVADQASGLGWRELR
ncbi:MAG: MBL fold metallo-hydrolase [Acidiferrobacteraceae bacterium]